jgi:uncharacterized membrane protein
VSTIFQPRRLSLKYDEEFGLVACILFCYGCFVFVLAVIFQNWSGLGVRACYYISKKRRHLYLYDPTGKLGDEVGFRPLYNKPSAHPSSPRRPEGRADSVVAAPQEGRGSYSRPLTYSHMVCFLPSKVVVFWVTFILSGKIKCFCFDKTGTLTMENLTFLGVQSREFYEGKTNGGSELFLPDSNSMGL